LRKVFKDMAPEEVLAVFDEFYKEIK